MTYFASLLPLVAIYAILVLGLNLQYGQAGILNFTYISFVAIGAYISAVLTLGPPDEGTVYVLASNVPFPVNILLGGVAATILGLLVSLTALRRLRSDYLAIVTLAAGQVFYTIVGNVIPLFNGFQGIDAVPLPVPGGLSQTGRQLVFGGMTLVFLAVTFIAVERIRRSPLGRVFRSVRDDETVTEAFGRNAGWLKLLAFLLGSFIAGIGGGLLVTYLSAYNPSAFVPADTFVLWAAMFVGGVGNNWGSLLGAALVPVAFVELTRFLPNLIGIDAALVQSLRGVAIGLLVILVPWFRPRGILPERLPRDREEGNGRAWKRGGEQPPKIGGKIEAGVPATRREPPGYAAASPASGSQGAVVQEQATILAVEDVSKSFGGLHAVSHCSFDVQSEAVTGLMGPNGAGKTTLLNLIAGELKPDSGRIIFQGDMIQGLPPYKVSRHGVARTFQLARELDRLTVMENLLLGPYPQRGERLISALLPAGPVAAEQTELRQQAREMLDIFELSALKDEATGNLSGGQKKLLELARAMMSKPRLLLLDEPTAGINPVLIDRLLEHIRSVRRMGVTIFVVEHNVAVIESLCDVVIVMDFGTVLARGTLADLRRDPKVVNAYLGARRAHGAA
ncbi:MAG: branched-chain amino acid ABC transporter ATP-binding protein/permease [Chloroflexi bacterium]|nr:branched-chain amino acid ABC transporter ATP-binding protein/permease [Chloroflexota bacterium]